MLGDDSTDSVCIIMTRMVLMLSTILSTLLLGPFYMLLGLLHRHSLDATVGNRLGVERLGLCILILAPCSSNSVSCRHPLNGRQYGSGTAWTSRIFGV
jgi:hypothetical protein